MALTSQLARPAHVRGISVVEVMVSITLGLLVSLIAIGLLLSSRRAFGSVDENTRLLESGNQALEAIARSARQAALVTWNSQSAPLGLAAEDEAVIKGLEDRGQNATSAGLDTNVNAINHSDVLSVRFYGSGTGQYGDESVLNCGGSGVPLTTDPSLPGRGWSIFYIGLSAGVPSLRCKYWTIGDNGTAVWRSEALVSGVDSMQVLYGIDTDMPPDGIANQFVTAQWIDAEDAKLTLEGADAAAKALDLNRKTRWKRVAALQVALLLRGDEASRVDTTAQNYLLFGPGYNAGKATAAGDAGAVFNEAGLKAGSSRSRKVFRMTVLLRNPVRWQP